ncbi:MAG: helix-turn-helix transcriptional regulator, partial [Acidobacteriota bacterium]
MDLIGMVGAQSGSTALAAAGLQKLPALVGSDLTTLSVCTLRTGHRRVLCNPVGAISDGDLACFDRFFYEHPLVRYHAGNPDGASHRISDSQPPRIFKRTALYNDYYRKVGIEHAIAVPLFVDSSLLVSFVLNRQGSDFSERDREVLDLVRRPLAALYRNALALDGVQQALSRVTTDDADDGWMLVSLNTARRVSGVAPRVQSWFSTAFGGEQTDPGALLPAVLDGAVAAQFSAIDGAFTIAATSCAVEGRGCRCTVQVLWRGDPTRDALVLIRRVGTAIGARNAARRELTVREREVLQWVAAGKTNAQIADILAA